MLPVILELLLAKRIFTGCLSYGYFIFLPITSDLQYIFWDLNLLIY